MNPLDKARQALQEALAKLPSEQEVANLTTEQLVFIIAEVVSHELDVRDAAIKTQKKERWDQCWKWVQRIGYVIVPLTGLAIAGKACDLY